MKKQRAWATVVYATTARHRARDPSWLWLAATIPISAAPVAGADLRFCWRFEAVAAYTRLVSLWPGRPAAQQTRATAAVAAMT